MQTFIFLFSRRRGNSEKPDFYSTGEWEEIHFLRKHGTSMKKNFKNLEKIRLGHFVHFNKKNIKILFSSSKRCKKRSIRTLSQFLEIRLFGSEHKKFTGIKLGLWPPEKLQTQILHVVILSKNFYQTSRVCHSNYVRKNTTIEDKYLKILPGHWVRDSDNPSACDVVGPGIFRADGYDHEKHQKWVFPCGRIEYLVLDWKVGF